MAVYDASAISAEAYQAAKASVDDVVVGMSKSAGQIYAQACATAMAGSATTGEKAIADAVQSLSEQGIYAYTYTRSDGVLVRVPCDVGIRRAVNAQGKVGRNQQVLDIATDNDCDLIEVNSTPNCRDEHEAIDGQIFSLSGESTKYPAWTMELEMLLDDYNCQHEIAIYTEGLGSRFSSSIKDAEFDNLPDDWTLEDAQETGKYTDAQVHQLITQQRKIENDIRKAKRSEEVLKDAGLDASRATAKLNSSRQALRELVSSNDSVLVRERHREQVYDSAKRMLAEVKAVETKPVVKEITLEASHYPKEFSNTKGKAKSLAAFNDHVNGVKGADPKVKEIFSNIGKMISDGRLGNFEVQYRSGGKCEVDYWRSTTPSGYRKTIMKVPNIAENAKATVSTMAHETGHLIDAMLRSHNADSWYTTQWEGFFTPDHATKPKGKILEVIRKAEDEKSLAHKEARKAYEDKLHSIEEKYKQGTISYRTYAKEFRAAGNRYKIEWELAGREAMYGVDKLEDIYDALNAGKMWGSRVDGVHMTYGHGAKYYRQAGNKIQETWANYCALQLMRPDLIELLRQEEPELIEWMDGVRDEILDKVRGM